MVYCLKRFDIKFVFFLESTLRIRVILLRFLIVTYKFFHISLNQTDQSSVETSDAARERFFVLALQH
jgi:hypothetical protein